MSVTVSDLFWQRCSKAADVKKIAPPKTKNELKELVLFFSKSKSKSKWIVCRGHEGHGDHGGQQNWSTFAVVQVQVQSSFYRYNVGIIVIVAATNAPGCQSLL